MPIISILQQPGSISTPKINAAYRPIIFVVRATRTDGQPVPPRVFCDVYINDLFFKTISSTQYKSLNQNDSDWEFDISSICQQSLGWKIGTNGGSAIENIPPITAPVYVKFRSCGYNADGFMVPEGIAPKQGTGLKQPVNGTGTQSESFHIINSALQHEENQDFQTHLQFARPNAFWEANTFPLTHRTNNYKVCKNDSDFYPFVHLGNKAFNTVVVVTRNRITGAQSSSTYSPPQSCTSVVSGLTAVVVPGQDTKVNFASSGPANQWQWTIDGGTTWTTVGATAFFITWDDLITQLLTEAGLPIETENGEIIIPDGIDPYQTYTLTIRPRCANGVFGTSATTTFTISPPSVCDVINGFGWNSNDYTARLIKLNMTMPAGFAAFQLQWRIDYGNGFYSNPTQEDYVLGSSPFAWSVPTDFVRGTIQFRVRTMCGANDFSEWSYWNGIPYQPPASTINVVLESIVNSGSIYVVTCTASGTTTDQLLITGFFVADASGGLKTFNFHCIIQPGETVGTVDVPGALSGGEATRTLDIVSVTPNPTSDGKKITF